MARRHPFAIFFLDAAFFYILTASGSVILSDGTSMLAVTQSLVHGHLHVPCGLGVPGLHGLCFSKYGAGWSITDTPLYLLGDALQRGLAVDPSLSLPNFASSFLNPLLMAGTASVVGKFAYELSRSLRLAAFVTIVFGLATPAWAYTKEGYSEPLVMLCLLAAGYLLRRRPSASMRSLVVAGGLLGLGLLTRPDALPLVLVIGGYGVASREGKRGLAWYGAVIIPILLFASLGLTYNAARFGNAFRTGYEFEGAGVGFVRTLGGTMFALRALLIDPTRGLLWFMPLLVAMVALFPAFFRLARREAVCCALLFLFAWVEHANLFISWEGGGTWGPRFFMPIIPFLVLPLVAIREHSRAAVRVLVALGSVAGFLVNLGPVLVNYNRYFYALRAGLRPGAWPQLYLWTTGISVLDHTARGLVPAGRIRELTTQGPLAVVERATSLNAPNFWWFFLVHGHIHTTLVVAALAACAAAMALSARSTYLVLRPGES